MSHILIVDDEKPILSSVGDVLKDEGYIRVEGNNPKGAKFIFELPVRG